MRGIPTPMRFCYEFPEMESRNTYLKRALLVALLIITLLVANATHSVLNPAISRDFDIAYIAQKCVGISQDQALNISEHIQHDPSIRANA